MNVIQPTPVTNDVLASSTATETHAEYNAATTYALGNRVTLASTGKVYECIQAPSTGKDPATNDLWWSIVGPSNRMAMFDNAVGTSTTADADLTVVLRPGGVSGVALLELVGKQVSVVMKDAPGGATIYSKTVVLDGTLIDSFYDWFYTEYAQLTDLVLTGLPVHFVSNELTISITGSSEVACGVCQIGEVFELGRVQRGAAVGITDYSRKAVDEFGNYSITKRAFSKRADVQLVTDAGRFNQIFRTLAALRATPCIYVGSSAQGMEPLIVYGFYRDFSIDVAYPDHHLCNLSIEGLI